LGFPAGAGAVAGAGAGPHAVHALGRAALGLLVRVGAGGAVRAVAGAHAGGARAGAGRPNLAARRARPADARPLLVLLAARFAGAEAGALATDAVDTMSERALAVQRAGFAASQLGRRVRGGVGAVVAPVAVGGRVRLPVDAAVGRTDDRRQRGD